MADTALGEILGGLWRFAATHPEWTKEEGGEEGWEPLVAWWAVACPPGLVLVDPLVEDWEALDRLVAAHGGCAGVIRTCHWHQRSVVETAARYDTKVWAKRHPGGIVEPDHEIVDRDELFGAIRVIDVERADEVGLWLVAQGALVFGDAMLRRAGGELRVCPASWTQPADGRERLLTVLRALLELPVEHVLVSHGQLVLGGGAAALARALSEPV